MATITLEVPEQVAERWNALSPAERNKFAVGVLAEHLDETNATDEIVIDYDAEEKALDAAFASVEAGRVKPADQVSADFFARHGIKPR